MNNVYYSPEKYGLEVVSEIEYSSGAWEFDTRMVWRHPEGHLVTARDSGCSCPSPFEGEGLNTLERVEYDLLEFEVREEQERDRSYVSELAAEDFLGKVRKALR